MSFIKKTHTPESDASSVYANDLEKRIGDAITIIDDQLSEQKNHIVESGRNANGSWEKWSNGDLIQWGTFNTGNIIFDVLTSGLYPAKTYPYITLPTEFLDGNYRAFSNYGGPGFLHTSLYGKEKARMRLKLAAWATSPFVADVDWLAIGKWK